MGNIIGCFPTTFSTCKKDVQQWGYIFMVRRVLECESWNMTPRLWRCLRWFGGSCGATKVGRCCVGSALLCEYLEQNGLGLMWHLSHMTLVLVGKCLVLEGWPSKIEVIRALGLYHPNPYHIQLKNVVPQAQPKPQALAPSLYQVLSGLLGLSTMASQATPDNVSPQKKKGLIRGSFCTAPTYGLIKSLCTRGTFAGG